MIWITTEKTTLYRNEEPVYSWYSKGEAPHEDIIQYLKQYAKDVCEHKVRVVFTNQWEVYDGDDLIYADDLGWLV